MLPERIRQSLALRLAAQYALVFACGAALLFGALYWHLAEALEEREQGAVEARAEVLERAYEVGGVAALRTELARETAPEVRSVFVRILGEGGETLFASVPADWIETQVQRLPLPERWGRGEVVREIRTVRVPQSAARDYAIASRILMDGGLLQVGRSTDSRAVLLAPVRRAFAGIGTVALALSLAAGTLLAWRATRPLRAVSETARRIVETGDLAARVPGAGRRGELAVLVQQLNTLLEKNATHVRVLRETLDNLAHDLRTPLMRMRRSLAAARVADSEAVREQLLNDAEADVNRALQTFSALIDLARAEAGLSRDSMEELDLDMLAKDMIDLLGPLAEDRGQRLECSISPVKVVGHRQILAQALGNLLENAIKYAPIGSALKLVVRPGADDAGPEIIVEDRGPGIPAHAREQAVKPFVRLEHPSRQPGSGLGLAIAAAVARLHRGKLILENAEPGLRVRLQLGIKQQGLSPAAT